MSDSSSSVPALRSANWNQLYRPRRVQDLHLATIRTALLSLMEAPHFPQVLLFAGPKGTGKTSVARIIGAMLNDPANEVAVEQRFFSQKNQKMMPLIEPDSTSSMAGSIFAGQSYIVQELDAASNRGIDDVRALKERAALPPSQGRMTVYILDEVHMLTIEAFNALLKLLEEPPAHTLFVLATTELHKLPETIISRCHLIRFHKATPEELEVPLRAIIADQHLNVDNATIILISRLADGSFRDGVKLLQQYVSSGRSDSQLAKLSETLSDDSIIRLLHAVMDKQPPAVVQEIEQLRQQGADEQHFLQSVAMYLHRDLLTSLKVEAGDAHFDERVARFFLQQLANPDLLKPAPIPFLRIELALLDLIDKSRTKTNKTGPSGANGSSPISSKASADIRQIAASTPVAVSAALDVAKDYVVLVEPENYTQVIDEMQAPVQALMQTSVQPPMQLTSTVTPHTNNSAALPLGDGKIVCEKWSELVAKASTYNFGLGTLLRSAQPIGGSQGAVLLRVYYSFHKEQLLQKKWHRFWNELTTEIAGGVVTVDCVVEKLAHSTTHESSLQPGVSLQALAVEALMQ